MSIDDSLFDEFGNYIGPGENISNGNADVAHNGNEHDYDNISEAEGEEMETEAIERRYRQQIVLHEDKKYYLSAEEIYGLEVETLVQDEDTQPLTEPVIAPVKINRFQHESTLKQLAPTYDPDFLVSLMGVPERVRSIAICGHLHHGKTSLIDVLVAFCHRGLGVSENKMPRYADLLFLEQEREVSINCKPLTLLLPTMGDTSMVINVMDTPGHADFNDEVAAAMRMADGVVIVVDIVEGLMCQTEDAIRNALFLRLPLILVINKMERLFLELKLPPTDAYYKIRHVIEEINTFVSNTNGHPNSSSYFSPEKGNVLFASTLGGWMFSLQSFSHIYLHRTNQATNSNKVEELAKRLWGDVYYQRESGRFLRNAIEGANKRTFITFVLEPLYKAYGAILTEERDELKSTLLTLGIRLKDFDYGLDTKTVIRMVLGILFGNAAKAFTSCIVDQMPNPKEASFYHIIHNLNGNLDSKISRLVQDCSSIEPIVTFAGKTYPKGDATQFDVLARVFSGSLSVGQQIRILGETFSAERNDEISVATITGLSIACGRYQIPVKSVPAGGFALISGIDGFIIKTGTIIDPHFPIEDLCVFKPLRVNNQALLKVAIEPITPSELPKMLDGLRKITKTYPLLTTKVEDSGEHIVLGTGELYMDCALHDLRCLYTGIEVKIADPVAKFAETVAEMSYLKCFAETPNRKNKITIIAEPLERGLTDALEAGRLPCPRGSIENIKELARILQNDYGWDILASRSVWAFGPDDKTGPCILLDDTLPSEVDKRSLELIKGYIIQGFQWACREGPLCEEMVRGVKFRLIECSVAEDSIDRAAGQFIPTVRRACYSAILTAGARLMEPVRVVEIQTQNEFVEAVYTVLAKRRGHVTHDSPKAGSPLYVIKAYIPLMDSFGLETDLRIHTQGMAFCQQRHDHWQIVSGDPLDSAIKLVPLEPSPAPYLARDYLLKTRRRKGLSEDVKISKFFDEAMLAELAREEALSGIKGLHV